MAEHLDTGKQGEDKAAEFLADKGYEIVVRNYRYRHAEIDIIAKKNKILAFVEVKTRTNLSYGMPEEFVDVTKRRLIILTVIGTVTFALMLFRSLLIQVLLKFSTSKMRFIEPRKRCLLCRAVR